MSSKTRNIARRHLSNMLKALMIRSMLGATKTEKTCQIAFLIIPRQASILDQIMLLSGERNQRSREDQWRAKIILDWKDIGRRKKLHSS